MYIELFVPIAARLASSFKAYKPYSRGYSLLLIRLFNILTRKSLPSTNIAFADTDQWQRNTVKSKGTTIRYLLFQKKYNKLIPCFLYSSIIE